MIRYELSGGYGYADFPEGICFTRGPKTYVRYTAPTGVVSYHGLVTLRVACGATKAELTRYVTWLGASVVFPLTAILEAMRPAGSGPYFTNVTLTVICGGGTASHTLRVVHVGTCEREVLPLSEQNAAVEELTIYPFARKIAVYPGFSTTQLLYIPKGATDIARVETPERAVIASEREANPFVAFDPSKTSWDFGSTLYLRVYGERDEFLAHPVPINTLPYPVLVDPCTAGVFLRWVDMSGMPYLYRWSQEAESHSVEADETYTRLDDTLTPYEIQTKTLERRYTLHSRIVERDIYEMCRTILAAQEIWMWDAELGDWTRCYIDKAEAEDTGAEMQDLTIEIIKSTYNL